MTGSTPPPRTVTVAFAADRRRDPPRRLAVLANGWITATVFVLAAMPPVSAQSPGRQTNSISSDVIARMITQRSFKDARWYSQRQWKRHDPLSDPAAAAAIDHFETIVAELRDSGTLTSQSLESSADDVIRYFASYPDHPRIRWWQAANLQAQRRIVESVVSQVLIAPGSVSLSEISRRLVEIGSQVDALRSQIQDDRETVAREAPRWIDDWITLDRRMAIERVRLALLQTDLFPDSDSERIAAASAAVEAAQSTLESIPPSAGATQTTRFLMAVALLRAEQSTRARQVLQTVTADPVTVAALQIELDLFDEDLSGAQKRLKDFFGDRPRVASKSPAMDLARLKFLVQSGASATMVTDWLAAMGERGGRYAARRGEAFLMTRLDEAASPPHPERPETGGSGPAMLAIQGRAMIRKGDQAEGARWLASAAKNTRDPETAIQLAIEAAAAWLAAGQPAESIALLLETARRFETAIASDLHYQAIHLSASHGLAEQVEPLLIEHLDRYENSKHRDTVVSWLIRWYDQSNRPIDAAAVARGEEAARRWRALGVDRNVDPTLLSKRLVGSLSSITAPDEIRQRRELAVEIAALSDWETVATVNPNGDHPPQLSRRGQAILGFRRGETRQLDVDPTASLVATLMRDARAKAAQRAPVARYVLATPESLASPSDRIRALIWTGDESAALSLLDKTLSDSKLVTDHLDLAAAIADSNLPTSRQRAVDLYDTIASGLPRNTDRWHQVKWSAIEALSRISHDQAQRRSRYLLLTESNIPEPWRSRYESIAQPRP